MPTGPLARRFGSTKNKLDLGREEHEGKIDRGGLCVDLTREDSAVLRAASNGRSIFHERWKRAEKQIAGREIGESFRI